MVGGRTRAEVEARGRGGDRVYMVADKQRRTPLTGFVAVLDSVLTPYLEMRDQTLSAISHAAFIAPPSGLNIRSPMLRPAR